MLENTGSILTVSSNHYKETERFLLSFDALVHLPVLGTRPWHQHGLFLIKRSHYLLTMR